MQAIRDKASCRAAMTGIHRVPYTSLKGLQVVGRWVHALRDLWPQGIMFNVQVVLVVYSSVQEP